MVATRGPRADTPYAVVVRYSGVFGASRDYVQSRHRKLATAMRRVHESEIAWLRLIGGQWSPLSWHVIDERDFTVHDGALKPTERGNNGKGNTHATARRTDRRSGAMGRPGQGHRAA